MCITNCLLINKAFIEYILCAKHFVGWLRYQDEEITNQLELMEMESRFFFRCSWAVKDKTVFLKSEV